MKSAITIISGMLLIPFYLFAQPSKSMTREEYISLHREDAIRDMQKTSVPASITMAQALLESSDGNSPLAVDARNHFGIKCSDWTGQTYIQDDDHKDECFRKYNTVLESYDDHSNFLKTRQRYAFLFDLDITDYKGWARGLKKAGYATDPHYADRLIKIIEDYHLYSLDQGQDPLLFAVKPPVTKPINPEANESVTADRSRNVFVPAVDAIDAFESRRVLSLNGVDYILARPGDTFHKLAKEFGLGYWQLPKYNETDADQELTAGQIVFLKPKKNKGEESYYIVKDGDSVYSISQATGVKMKYILKYNELSGNSELPPGRKIYLKKNNS